jgi:hypothetical protein
MSEKVTWSPELSEQLLLAIIKVHGIKTDDAAIASEMGVSKNTVVWQLRKMKARAKGMTVKGSQVGSSRKSPNQTPTKRKRKSAEVKEDSDEEADKDVFLSPLSPSKRGKLLMYKDGSDED